MKATCLLFFLTALNSFSMAQSTDDFIGTWRVDLPSTIQNMNENEKSKYDSLSDRARSNLEQAFSSRIFQFNAEAKVIVSFSARGSARSVDGSWRYDADSKVLSILAGGINRHFDVQWLNSKAIFLRYQNIDKGGLFQTLSLNKQ